MGICLRLGNIFILDAKTHFCQDSRHTEIRYPALQSREAEIKILLCIWLHMLTFGGLTLSHQESPSPVL